jgi:hypothetical protein
MQKEVSTVDSLVHAAEQPARKPLYPPSMPQRVAKECPYFHGASAAAAVPLLSVLAVAAGLAAQERPAAAAAAPVRMTVMS